MQIFKILRPDEWADMQRDGQTRGAPVDLSDGYIHFSTAVQAQATLDKHFADATEVVILTCEADRMPDALRWEVSRGGALFPHLYRPLLMADVIEVRHVARGPSGFAPL